MENTKNTKRASRFLKAESQQIIIQRGMKAEENCRERLAKKCEKKDKSRTKTATSSAGRTNKTSKGKKLSCTKIYLIEIIRQNKTIDFFSKNALFYA